ncbi:hypothetical protein KXR87_13160 [Yokenella regensburgei]|uniref:hypothetical protein n=1 Tax=Yokenella regensburgei TaxID=158877 RepID=UPI003F17D4DB
MTLLELLVQELPKRGGWPDGYDVASINHYGCVCFYITSLNGNATGYVTDIHTSENGRMTREQYEAALAAAKKPVWKGEDLPPVGTECETLHCFVGSEWKRVIIKWSDENQFLYEWVRQGHPVHHMLAYVGQHKFRPIRSEADKKRDESTKVIADSLFKDGDFDYKESLRLAGFVYGDIAAGKIPGVRIE